MNTEDLDEYLPGFGEIWMNGVLMVKNVVHLAQDSIVKSHLRWLQFLLNRFDFILFLLTFFALWFVVGAKAKPSNSIDIFLTSLYLGVLGLLKVFIFYFGFQFKLSDCLFGFIGMGIEDDDLDLKKFLRFLNHVEHGRAYYLLYLGVILLRMVSIVILNRQVFSILYPYTPKTKTDSKLIHFACNVAPLLYASCELYKTGCMLAVLFFTLREDLITEAFISRIYFVYLLKSVLMASFLALYFFGYILKNDVKAVTSHKNEPGKESRRRSSRLANRYKGE